MLRDTVGQRVPQWRSQLRAKQNKMGALRASLRKAQQDVSPVQPSGSLPIPPAPPLPEYWYPEYCPPLPPALTLYCC